MIKSFLLAGACLTTLLLQTSCHESAESPAEGQPPSVTALAIVNGKVISEQEVMANLIGHQTMDSFPEIHQQKITALLNVLIEKELAAQKAVELGLDKDPEFLAKLRSLNPDIETFNRDQLSGLFEAKEILAKAIVTDAEIDKFVIDNEENIRSELHILQLMQRSEEKVQEISEQLASGKSFTAVVSEQFPDLPADFKRPWDMGFLNWEQIPDAWMNTLADMKPGETSAVLKDTRDRFWIIHLVERRPSADFNLESSKVRIRQLLEKEKVARLRSETMQALLDAATIVYPDRSH